MNLHSKRLIKNIPNSLKFIVTTSLLNIIIWYCLTILIKNLIFDVEPIPLIIDDNNQSLCYANFVWTNKNKKFRLNDILDDDVLENSNGKNIFFHLTNCIHDGIIRIRPR